jgi:paraquat-inducible protein B
MQNSKDDLSNVEIEEAVWRKKRKAISTVWIVPIVALIVGAWLIIQSINEKGPVIHITFKSAEGVQAEKTVIKYKDIVVGKVTDVDFNKDLSNVIVTAEMKKNMKAYLSEESRFWVMKARVGLNQVEGLDTLLSGVYIVMDPQK